MLVPKSWSSWIKTPASQRASHYASQVLREPFLFFSRVSIVKEVLTDQGSCFMFWVNEMCKLLKVSQIRTSVYYPQIEVLVERFNTNLKQMLRDYWCGWETLGPTNPLVLFSIREVPQASTGFPAFELLYGQWPRGMREQMQQVQCAQVWIYNRNT